MDNADNKEQALQKFMVRVKRDLHDKYFSQIHSLKKQKKPIPCTYSEWIDYFIYMTDYAELYAKWEQSGKTKYKRDKGIKPRIIKMDMFLPLSLDNVRVVLQNEMSDYKNKSEENEFFYEIKRKNRRKKEHRDKKDLLKYRFSAHKKDFDNLKIFKRTILKDKNYNELFDEWERSDFDSNKKPVILTHKSKFTILPKKEFHGIVGSVYLNAYRDIKVGLINKKENQDEL